MSLSGLIKALRNRKDDQAVVQEALQDIAAEIKSTDLNVKAAAVLKLVYLEMLGHPAILSFSFALVECMSSSKFHIKQIGYLAAAQSFAASTEVILLANNLIKKDLQTSSHPSTVILALTSLPALLVASPQLAEDILPELLRMLTHSKAQVRRIATLTVGKIWCTTYPSLASSSSAASSPFTHSAFEFSHVEKLRSGLTDDDPSVVSATVNVMLELARSRQDSLQSLLGLAPELFDLLTNSTNNWMLIKIAKLFALLTPIEPRLVRKLLPPLTNLISTTPAFSLLYECIQTVITGGMLSDSDAASPLAQNCIAKLSSFLSDKDQNLRYIALKGLSRLLRNAPHTAPLLLQHYDDILICINEEDLTIRLKALELVERLTDRSNCKAIVMRLLDQISPSSGGTTSASKGASAGLPSATGALRAVSSSYDTSSPSGLAIQPTSSSTASASSFALSHYRYRLLLLVLRLTSRSSEDGSQLYVNITNFEWYLDTLVTAAYLSLSVLSTLTPFEVDKLASKLSACLLDVTARAPSIRSFAVKRCHRLVADHGFVALQNPVTVAVTSACAFILGEYGQGADLVESSEVLIEGPLASNHPPSGACLAVMHCLALWLSDMADQWLAEYYIKAKSTLENVCKVMENVEGEEASLYVKLIRLVLTGLERELTKSGPDTSAAPGTRAHSIGINDDLVDDPYASGTSDTGVLDETAISSVNSPPRSLLLLRAIFAGYELRPLAPNAQALVAPPDSLDMNAPIAANSTTLSTWGNHREKLKGAQSQGQNMDVDEYGRPKASVAASLHLPVADGISVTDSSIIGAKPKRTKKKAVDDVERDGKTRKQRAPPGQGSSTDDVDSIPIVKLELTDQEDVSLGLGKGSNSRKGSQRERKSAPLASRVRTPSPPPIIVAAGGEVPVARPSFGRPDEATGILASESQEVLGNQGQVAGNIDGSTTTVSDPAKVKVIKKKKRKKEKDGRLEGTRAE